LKNVCEAWVTWNEQMPIMVRVTRAAGLPLPVAFPACLPPGGRLHGWTPAWVAAQVILSGVLVGALTPLELADPFLVRYRTEANAADLMELGAAVLGRDLAEGLRGLYRREAATVNGNTDKVHKRRVRAPYWQAQR